MRVLARRCDGSLPDERSVEIDFGLPEASCDLPKLRFVAGSRAALTNTLGASPLKFGFDFSKTEATKLRPTRALQLDFPKSAVHFSEMQPVCSM